MKTNKINQGSQKKKIITIGISIAIVIVSISSLILISTSSNESDNFDVAFIKKDLKSYPNHTLWLVANFKHSGNPLTDNFEIVVESNNSINFDYEMCASDNFNHVVDIFVRPNISHINHIISIKLNISQDELITSDSAIFTVINWSSNYDDSLESMRGQFISYLNQNRPEINITSIASWEYLGIIPQILVVEHHLFKCEDWELEISRHVMIAPHDWVKVYIRPRSGINPIWAGEISSWSTDNQTVIEIEIPPTISR